MTNETNAKDKTANNQIELLQKLLNESKEEMQNAKNELLHFRRKINAEKCEKHVTEIETK